MPEYIQINDTLLFFWIKETLKEINIERFIR